MTLEVIAIREQDVKDAVRFGADRIGLVTGMTEGGLTSDTLEPFIRPTAVREVHFSAVRVDGSFSKPIDPARIDWLPGIVDAICAGHD